MQARVCVHFVRLKSAYIVNAAGCGCITAATEDLYPADAGIEIKIVVFQDCICSCHELHASGIGICGHHQLVTLYRDRKPGINKLEVLGRTEQHTSLAALTKFGAKTALLGKVGTDTFGKLLINTLADAGIDTTGLISTDDVFTTLAFVTFDEHGDRQFAFSRKPGADTCITFEELKLSLIDEARVFHFGTLSLTDEPARSATYQAVAYAKSKGKFITYDPNLRKPLWKDLETAKQQLIWGLQQADVVKISDEEVDFLFGLGVEDGAAYILENFGVKLVFVTCGANGCFFKNATAQGHVPSLTGIKVIDTTGAGDIFGGSAVWKLLQFNKAPEALSEEDLHQIVRFACTSAGLSTTKSGGISSVPDLDSILANM